MAGSASIVARSSSARSIWSMMSGARLERALISAMTGDISSSAHPLAAGRQRKIFLRSRSWDARCFFAPQAMIVS
jgi:ribosomal protein L31